MFEQLQSLIAQYSSRRLTHDSDRLDAFCGILNMFARHQFAGIEHVAGIPFYSNHYYAFAEDTATKSPRPTVPSFRVCYGPTASTPTVQATVQTSRSNNTRMEQ